MDKTTSWHDRRLYFYQTTGFRNENVFSYDLKTKEERILPRSLFEQYPVYFSDTLWDPNTKTTYVNFSEINYNRFSELAGWHIISFTKDNGFDVQRAEGFPATSRNPPLRKLGDGHILYSNIKTYQHPKKAVEYFRIVASNTDEILWCLTETKLNILTNTNIYWVGDAWLLKKSSRLADVEYRMFNYLTGIERHYSIYPEIIMGYGDGYIAITSQEFRGITIMDTSNNIIFQDTSFELTAMVDGKYTHQPVKSVGFGYIDLPYVYYSVISSFGIPHIECSVILDLQTYKTYITSERWKILGVSYEY